MEADGSGLTALRDAFAAQGELVVRAIDMTGPAEPTRCAGWSVADLDRHLGAIMGGLARLLEHPHDGPADTGVTGWAQALPALSAAIDTRARTEGPGLGSSMAELRTALDRADGSAVVQQATGRHTLPDALLFRVIELVVHGLDLPAPVTPEPEALAVVVRAFAGLLAERSPGADATVHVAHLAAVTCSPAARAEGVDRPVLIEIDPVPFVDLCAGRITWAGAVGQGLVRVSGGQADLSGCLPLVA